jgi:hypothetical protein
MAVETKVILKSLLFNAMRCKTRGEIIAMLENTLENDEIAGVQKKVKDAEERANNTQ